MAEIRLCISLCPGCRLLCCMSAIPDASTSCYVACLPYQMPAPPLLGCCISTCHGVHLIASYYPCSCTLKHERFTQNQKKSATSEAGGTESP